MRVPPLLLVACLAVGADWLSCRLLMQRTHAAYDHWVRVMSDQGWSVRTGAVVEAGMPFGARLSVQDLTLRGGHAIVPGGLDLHCERVVLGLGIASPFRLTVAPEGEETLRLAGLPPVVFYADPVTASVKMWRGPGDSIDVDANGLAGSLQRSDHTQDIRVDHVHMHIAAARGESARTTARVSLEAHGVELPDDGRWPLGATINALGADVSLASPALSGIGAADQARAWHDWGGALTLERLDVHWGPLTIATTARLGLDDRLQPAGSGTAQVAGWGGTLDALARAGTIPPGVGQTAKAVLATMVPAEPPSAGAALSLPFTLRESTLSVGKLPLMHVRTVAWGGA